MSALGDANAAWRNAVADEREARLRLVQAIRKAKESMPVAEIARILNVSRQRVEQISKETRT